MNRSTPLRFVLLLTVWATLPPRRAAAQTALVLPSPLGLGDVIRIAGDRRDEIQASRTRTRAGEQRPVIVSALADPMISPSLDHLPFMLGGADASLTIGATNPVVRHSRASSYLGASRCRSVAGRHQPNHARCGSAVCEGVPDAAGAAPDSDTGQRTDCVRARGRPRRECEICRRHCATIRSSAR